MTKLNPKKSNEIRQAVLDALERQGHSRYWLARQVKCQTAVYAWLKGERDVYASLAARCLTALKLEIKPCGLPPFSVPVRSR